MEYNGKQFIDRLIEVSGNKTKADIANELMVDASTITRWTKNQPKTDNLLQIAATYNCSIDYLLGITNTNPGQGKTKRLIDIIRDMFICDMQGDTDCRLLFSSDCDNDVFPYGNFPYGKICFDNVIGANGHPNNINYGELFEKYAGIKGAFALIDDEQIKIGMIDTLIKQYDNDVLLDFLNNLNELPFK